MNVLSGTMPVSKPKYLKTHDDFDTGLNETYTYNGKLYLGLLIVPSINSKSSIVKLVASSKRTSLISAKPLMRSGSSRPRHLNYVPFKIQVALNSVLLNLKYGLNLNSSIALFNSRQTPSTTLLVFLFINKILRFSFKPLISNF
jgi:hypothetical protein